jgi:HK97 gp10 family phage protein
MPRNLVTPKGKFAIVEGLPDLQKRIADILGRTVSGFEVKKVWMKGAIIIRDEAKRLAPIIQSETHNLKPWQRPGSLKAAIYAAYGKDSAPNVIVGVNYRKAPQAKWIEYGTAERTTKTGENRGHTPAQPYMRPALITKRAEAIAAMAEGYRELIEASA